MKKTLLFLFALATLVAISSAQTSIFINEIHYDNVSGDVNEGVEIAGPAGTDVTGWMLFFYNGSTGAVYASDTFKVTIPDQQNGFGTLWIARAGIQNGAPDGVALVNPSNTVIQFLSYEGEILATDGPASGMTSTDIGVVEGGSTGTDQSMQLTGQGETYEDFTWMTDLTATNGAVNTGQVFGILPEPDNHVTAFAAGTQTFSRIPVTWTDATGTNLPSGYLIKANTTGLGDLLAPVDGTPENDQLLVRNVAYGQESFLFVGLEAATTYYIKIWPYSNSGSLIDYKIDGTVPELTVATNGADTIILFEDFELDPEDWTTVNDSGAQEWQPGSIGADGTNGSGYINGYNFSDDVNVDWLFAPAVNLDAWNNEVLTFYNRWRYGTSDEREYLKLLYSTDYNGDGASFNGATWTEIPFDSSATDQTWFQVTDIDLSGISGSNVYFAFKYRSDDNQRAWWIDEIMIKGDFTGELTPPVWEAGYPRVDDVQEERFDVVANINEPGKVYFMVLNDGDPAPDIADVMGSDTLEIMYGGQDYSTTVDNLEQGTSYDVYFIAEDALGNMQDTTVLVDVTTLDLRTLEMTFPVGGENFYVGDTVTVTWNSSNIDSITLYVDVFEGQGWNPIEGEDVKIGADLGEWQVLVPLSAGVDSVKMLIADADDFSVNDSCGTFNLTDTINPMIHTLKPENKSVNVSILPKLAVIFNEWVEKGTGNVTIHEDDGTLIETIAVTGDQVETEETEGVVIAKIQTSVKLENEKGYYVLIDAGTFVDFKGNPFDGITTDTVWTFTTSPADIFFSEYIEGSSSNKALEIMNATGVDVDLSNYQIWRANNGAVWIDGSTYQLSGILEADSMLVICNASASDEIKARSDSVGGVLDGTTWFNGDDAVGIFKFDGGNWILLDVIGLEGNDPGAGWDVAGVSQATSNHTLIRKGFIVTGNPNWESSAGENAFDSEWKVYPQDYIDNLGLASPPPSTEAEIDSFKLAEQTGPAVINSTGATVDIEVILGTDLSSLVPSIWISEGAKIDPPSGEPVDFSTGTVMFTVTAENMITTKVWTVNVTVAEELSSEKKILSFVLDEETKDAVIDTTAFTVTAEVEYGTDLSSLTPTITYSAGATINPESGVAQDFSAGAVTYTVTAQDASTQDWAVTVTAVQPVEVANLAALRASTADNSTLYKVTGEVIVTGFMDYRGRKYLQDATAAIEIDDDVLKAVTTVYNIGDGIMGLTGTLENWHGWLEIHPVVDPGAPTSTGNTITPKTIGIDDFKSNFADHAAQLIRIDTVTLSKTGNFANGDQIDIARDGDTTILFVNFYDTHLTGSPIPVAANVTGIAYWHYDEAKIVPRDTADVETIQIPDRVEDLLSDQMVKVYPNPSSGKITLELTLGGVSDIDVEIISMNGSMVYRNSHYSVTSVREQINLNGYASGMYMLKVWNADKVSMHKIVIQ